MGMGCNKKIDIKNAVGSEIVFYFSFITDVAGINQNSFLRSFYQYTFRLTDVDKMDFQFGTFRNIALNRCKKFEVKIVGNYSVFI